MLVTIYINPELGIVILAGNHTGIAELEKVQLRFCTFTRNEHNSLSTHFA